MALAREHILSVNTAEQFNSAALEIFGYQYNDNTVYRQFSDYLGRNPGNVKTVGQIPFMPVEFFRNHRVITGASEPQLVFESSGTTGSFPSRHYVTDPGLYEASFTEAFRIFYGSPEDYVILALLPSYTEREGSSLVYMADRLIKMTGSELSGFYREQPGSVLSAVEKARAAGRKVLLLGVSFALLDLAENEAPDLSGTIIMETGGMKGRRKEITRGELHEVLCDRLHVPAIHSEYGMTELLSQAYSFGDGVFRCPPWMSILVRDPQDPLSIINEYDRSGGINIIDLANLNSCSFLATGDLGRLFTDGSFEILGRFDASDIRGCNLMAE